MTQQSLDHLDAEGRRVVGHDGASGWRVFNQTIFCISKDGKVINRISGDSLSITGAQIRAARALLGITAQELADAASVGVATVRRAEASDGTAITPANLKAIQRALEAGGVSFVESNGGGVGVRLKA
jgi:hypothetical protein